MRRTHPLLAGLALAGIAGSLAAARTATAQNPAPIVHLYTGGAALAEGLRLGGWGSGMASEDRSRHSLGASSIRVETHGYYSGARIEFQAPKDLTAQKNDPNGYLELIVQFKPGTLRQRREAARGGFPGSGGYPGSGGFPGEGSVAGPPGGFPGGLPEGGFPGPYGGGFPGAGGQSLAPDTKKLKVVLVDDAGKQYVATEFPVTLMPAPAAEGWFSVAIPFVAFKGLRQAPTARIKEIRIFGDTTDTFWIGEIRTTTDSEPIVVEPLDYMEVAVDEAVEFQAQATGGLSPLHYSWDFNKADGIQEDAVGQTVIHVFRKPSPESGKPGELQPYVVTLTVSDLSGAKKPVRREFDVIVNP